MKNGTVLQLFYIEGEATPRYSVYSEHIPRIDDWIAEDRRKVMRVTWHYAASSLSTFRELNYVEVVLA